MTRLTAVLFVASSVRLVTAASALVFAPPSQGPLLENTNFATTASTPLFESLVEQGILLTNYVAAIGGDFFGMHDDNMYHIPSNISTVIDLLEDKHVSWVTYQENMPAHEFSRCNQWHAAAAGVRYTEYGASHVSFPSSFVPPSSLSFPVPSLIPVSRYSSWRPQVNDAHDTTIDFAASFLEYWLLPLLSEPRANDNETLILLTFDEMETYTIQNNVFAVALGAFPLLLPIPRFHSHLRHTTSASYPRVNWHFHNVHALLDVSTVQANWGLKSLARQAHSTISNILCFVAAKTGYRNVDVPGTEMPQFNLTGVVSGALTKLGERSQTLTTEQRLGVHEKRLAMGNDHAAWGKTMDAACAMETTTGAAWNGRWYGRGLRGSGE
ncbi:hypothetical protein B0H13DRAFT_2306829 [Mycena leptocephala]|nr:hypothetical protein B0H13DRAFT_2306829 [Mycena leptocephala]